jgi:hypothetical protein
MDPFSFRPQHSHPSVTEIGPGEVPTVRFAEGATENARIASMFGRAAASRGTKSPLTTGLNERDYDRRQQAARSSRQRKSNARRAKAMRQRDTALADLQAQIRVASGQTGASPALVDNARKALQAKVSKLQSEMPGLSDEDAVEAIYTAAGLL